MKQKVKAAIMVGMLFELQSCKTAAKLITKLGQHKTRSNIQSESSSNSEKRHGCSILL